MKKTFTLLFIAASLLTITSCKKTEVCETGYTGSNCNTQITPSRILITNIQINSFPPTASNGSGWDLTDGADIFPEFLNSSQQVIKSFSSNRISNASPYASYYFTPTPSIEITNVTGQYILALYDWDGVSANDFMRGISFYPYSSTNGFPKTVTYNVGTGFSFTLSYSYVF